MIATYGHTNPAFVTNFFNAQKEKLLKTFTIDQIQGAIDPVVYVEEKRFREKHGALASNDRELLEIESVKISVQE